MEHEQNIPEQRKEAETHRESDTPDVPPALSAAGETVGDGDAPAAAAPAAPALRRRRGRTILLIAGAAVLGVLAGTVTGYAVQYHRAPTSLAPLAQQELVTPKALAPDDATTNKTINANRWHKTDDDLSKLLVEAPGGAKVEGVGYQSLDFLATDFEEPENAFRNLAEDRIRRVASRVWVADERVFVHINLLQFHDFADAEDYQQEQADYMPEKRYAGNPGVAIPGLAADLGHVWVYSEAEEEPGYHPIRQARAIARRGDIVMEISYVENRGKVSESAVLDLAKQQLERL